MAGYPSTRWSQVVAANGSGEPARAALAWLCGRYWECLAAHVRRRGFTHEDAEDLTQEFLLSVVSGHGAILERADPARGRFRTFLLACLDHQLMHARARRAALKRGGGIDHDGVEAIAEADAVAGGSFDRDWAHQVVARARDRIRSEETADRWTHLSPFLASNGNATGYRKAGSELGMREGAVKVAVHRLRERFRQALRDEVAQTLGEPEPTLVDSELAHLLAALGQGL